MSNLALNKKVIEPEVKQPGVVTDGNVTNYNGNKGFAYFVFPGTLTINLEQLLLIQCIRILLWDGLGYGGTLNKRRYQYRLAISKDGNIWDEIFRTSEKGTIGWQIFKFRNPIKIKYIRIYGLHNTANRNIHIVEVEAHDEIPDNPKGNVHIGNDLELDLEHDELRSPTKIDSKELNRIIETLEKSLIDKQVVKDIKARFEDLIVLDQNLNAIRREIVNPVTTEMKKSNRFAVIALILTIIGLILTIALRLIFG